MGVWRCRIPARWAGFAQPVRRCGRLPPDRHSLSRAALLCAQAQTRVCLRLVLVVLTGRAHRSIGGVRVRACAAGRTTTVGCGCRRYILELTRGAGCVLQARAQARAWLVLVRLAGRARKGIGAVRIRARWTRLTLSIAQLRCTLDDALARTARCPYETPTLTGGALVLTICACGALC